MNSKKMLALVLVLLIAACGQKANNSNSNKETSSPDLQKNYKQNVSLLVSFDENKNEQTPNFSWTDSSGKKVSFSEFTKGKPVLVNFWATWCGPCVKEIPDLAALNQEYTAKGAVIIGISADLDDDALALVSEFAAEKKVSYPIIIDGGKLQEPFGGIRGLPTTFFIDKSGKIVKKLVGLQSKETFSKNLDALL